MFKRYSIGLQPLRKTLEQERQPHVLLQLADDPLAIGLGHAQEVTRHYSDMSSLTRPGRCALPLRPGMVTWLVYADNRMIHCCCDGIAGTLAREERYYVGAQCKRAWSGGSTLQQHPRRWDRGAQEAPCLLKGIRNSLPRMWDCFVTRDRAKSHSWGPEACSPRGIGQLPIAAINRIYLSSQRICDLGKTRV